MQVIDTSGEKKDGKAIADMHLKLFDEITNGRPELVAYVVMDSPKNNLAAMRILQEQLTQLITLSCQCHAINSFCKDLANAKKCPEVAALLQVGTDSIL